MMIERPVSFNDHLEWTEPAIQEVLLNLQKRIMALDPQVKERVTKQRRISYRINETPFAEVKVQKTRILVRVLDMRVPDPTKLSTHIAYAETHNWRLGEEIRINSLALIDDTMPFIEASYRGCLRK